MLKLTKSVSNFTFQLSYVNIISLNVLESKFFCYQMTPLLPINYTDSLM
jgi:hypothetical protein